MPHEQPWLDDYATRHRAELQARWDEEAKVFNIQNAAMRTVLNECPLKLRTRKDCQACGNEACVKAYEEQNKLWPENECDDLNQICNAVVACERLMSIIVGRDHANP